MSDLAWLNAFGADLNSATNSATTLAGVGSHNTINGPVTTVADQNVGSSGFGGGFSENEGSNSALTLAGVGDHNRVNGSVTTEANQSVGSHSGIEPLFGHGGEHSDFGPHSGFGGSENVASNSALTLAGVGSHNTINGGVTTEANQNVGSSEFGRMFGGGEHADLGHGGFGENIASNSALTLAGVGDHNRINGPVTTEANQSVGSHSGFGGMFGHAEHGNFGGGVTTEAFVHVGDQGAALHHG